MNKLLEGFLFGTGFTVAAAVIWSLYTLVAFPAVYSSKLENSPARSIDGDPVEIVPTTSGAAADERKFELHKGRSSRMEIPSGGGILSLAVIDSQEGSDRPSTIQAWVTESEAFLIETTGEVPKVKKVPYPKTSPADFAGDLVREYAGFRDNNLTTTINAAEIRGLRNGVPTNHHDMNGALRITREGVVFFVPNKFEA